MNPRDEFRDLVGRTRRLIEAAALLVITAAQFAVSVATLFATAWITIFDTLRRAADRMAGRVAVKANA